MNAVGPTASGTGPTITTLAHESRTYPPDPAFAATANADAAFVAAAEADPLAFWAR